MLGRVCVKKLKKTRSGPKIPAGGLFGGGETSRFGPNLDKLQKSMDTDVEYCWFSTKYANDQISHLGRMGRTDKMCRIGQSA